MLVYVTCPDIRQQPHQSTHDSHYEPRGTASVPGGKRYRRQIQYRNTDFATRQQVQGADDGYEYEGFKYDLASALLRKMRCKVRHHNGSLVSIPYQNPSIIIKPVLFTHESSQILHLEYRPRALCKAKFSNKSPSRAAQHQDRRIWFSCLWTQDGRPMLKEGT